MVGNSILVLLPPLVTIGLAVVTRQVVFSLSIGIFLGFLILADFSLPLALVNSIEGVVGIYKQDWAIKVILFTMMVSGIIHLAKVTGGTRGLVRLLTEKRSVVRGPISTQLLGAAIACAVFIDSYLAMLTSGAVTADLARKYRVSREQLAYVTKNTGISVWSSVMINGWGAAMMGIIAGQVQLNYIQGQPFAILAKSMVYNLFAWASILVVFLTLFTKFSFPAMRRANARAAEGIELREGAVPMAPDEDDSEILHKPDVSNLLLPLLTTILFTPVALYITGDGVIANGSGSTSVLWAVLLGQFVAFIYYVPIRRILSLGQFFDHLLKGYQEMVPLVVVLTLAILIGSVAGQLEIGAYIAQHIGGSVPASMIAPFIFVIAAVISLSTGTSWGTFSIMIPIGIQLAVASGVDPYLAIGAAISGSVLGDVVSPISDTGIMISTATKNDLMDHIKTQFPYCMTAGAIAFAGFMILGTVVG